MRFIIVQKSVIDDFKEKDNMANTVLLAGGAGYIGSHTAIELMSNGYDVVIVDNHSNSQPEVYNRIEQISGKSVKHYDIDVCDVEKLEEVFIDNKIDAVIHFAGYKAVGESVEKPLMYYENNLNSTYAIIKMMQ